MHQQPYYLARTLCSSSRRSKDDNKSSLLPISASICVQVYDWFFPSNDWFSIYTTFFRQIDLFSSKGLVFIILTFSVKWLDFQSVKTGPTRNQVIWRKNIINDEKPPVTKLENQLLYGKQSDLRAYGSTCDIDCTLLKLVIFKV